MVGCDGQLRTRTQSVGAGRAVVLAAPRGALLSDRKRRAPALGCYITHILLLVVYKMICYFVNYVYQKAG
jgi:hypothetical protein